MKKKSVYLIILLIAIIIQTSVLPVLMEKNSVSDNVLMLILAWSVIDGFAAFLGWAIFAGIIYDLASYTPVGIHVLVFLAIVYGVSFFSRRISLDLKGVGLLLILLFILGATFFSNLLIVFSLTAEDFPHVFWQSLGSFSSLTIQVAVNAILFFVWYMIIKKVKRFFEISA